ncbi:MAG: amidohydrolase family protein [Opitutaceae bacterium]|nr:amidohydrolase family protein [Opitutaceae bacterium]
MKRLLARIRRGVTGVTATVLVAAVSWGATNPPPLLLANGRIYTGTERAPSAEAVLAINGRIAYVGSEAGARQHAPAGVQIIDLYEKAFAAVPPAERAIAAPRWRIEHAQVVHPDDQPRFAKLGVIASMQPSHAIGDLYFAPSRLGPARVGTAYAWRSLLNAGITIAGGSDAPVERGEPQIEFYAAVTRRSLDGFANADWHPEQRVTRAEALKMFTLWPAFASFEEDQRGTIEPGKVADFTAWSGDLMTIPEPEILRARCVMTVIGGEVVWSGLQTP